MIVDLSPTDEIIQAEREAFAEPGRDDQPFDKRQVIFGRVNGRELPGTVYLPRSAGQGRRGVVMVHGGGWRAGDRGQFARHAAFMAAARDLVTLLVAYRFYDEAAFPACVQDARCGVRWLRANAGDLGVDPDRIAIGGSSAGAHIAAVAAVTADDPFEPTGGNADVPSAVRAGVYFNGVFELPKRDGERLDDTAVRGLLGGDPQDVPERYRAASPIHHVTPAGPPALLLHGDIDSIISLKQSIRFAEKLTAAGVPAELVVVPNTDHGNLTDEVNFVPCLMRMIAFLERHLPGANA